MVSPSSATLLLFWFMIILLNMNFSQNFLYKVNLKIKMQANV